MNACFWVHLYIDKAEIIGQKSLRVRVLCGLRAWGMLALIGCAGLGTIDQQGALRHVVPRAQRNAYLHIYTPRRNIYHYRLFLLLSCMHQPVQPKSLS
jgi:hypothetical protein